MVFSFFDDFIIEKREMRVCFLQMISVPLQLATPSNSSTTVSLHSEHRNGDGGQENSRRYCIILWF